MTMKTFWKGVIGAALGGATASLTGVAVVHDLTIKQISVIASVGAISHVAAYLKQSPEEVEAAAKTVKKEAESDGHSE